MKVLNRKKGFTLVELIVVIAIIGILSAVLIPSITGYIAKAKESNAIQEGKAVYNVYVTYLTEVEAGQAAKNKTFTEYYEEVTNENITGSVWVAYEKANDELTELTESVGNVYHKEEEEEPPVPSYFIYQSGSIYVKVLLDGNVSLAVGTDYLDQ